MKWRKLKSVKPDDPKGMDNPREARMYKWEKWKYDYMQSPFHHDPTEYPDYMETKPPPSKSDSVDMPRIHVKGTSGYRILEPKKHDTNLPSKNRMTSARKKKVDEFIQGIFNKAISVLKGG